MLMAPGGVVTVPGQAVSPSGTAPVMFGAAATETFPGRASTRAAVRRITTGFSLFSRMNSVLVPRTPMLAGSKVLLTPGGRRTLRSDSLGFWLVNPCRLLMAPAAMVLVRVPTSEATTAAGQCSGRRPRPWRR